MSTKSLLFLISGPSGVGKSTVVERILLEVPSLSKLVTTTSRPPRPGETDGVHYWFVSEKAFLKMVDESGFVEWKHHFQHYYGLTWSAISESSGHDQIFDVDTFGKADIVRQIPDRVITIFLLPPSFDDLRSRLTHRSDFSEDELNGRLDKARIELERSNEYDYTVENKDLDETIRSLREIIVTEKYNREMISQDDK